MLRVFLGDREPLLATAAAWLVEEASASASPRAAVKLIDLEPFLVVVPGRRAGRRLLERLVGSVPGGAAGFVPPTVVTPGELPELLWRFERAPASEIGALWARIETLVEAPPEVLEALSPEPPRRHDLLGWLDLARELNRLDDELAVEALATGDVLRALENDGAPGAELRRWTSIRTLRRSFEERLAKHGHASRAQARLHALAAVRAPSGSGARLDRRAAVLRRAVLVGVADLPRLFRELLDHSGLEVAALVPAPPERAADFDESGCPRAEAFLGRELHDRDATVLVAERPLAQAAVAASCVESLVAQTETGFAPSEITVSTASVESLSMVDDALERAGLQHHVPTGRRLRESAPAVLLRRLADYLGEGTLEALAQLLRLPAVERAFEGRADRLREGLLATSAPATTVGRRVRRAVEERRYLEALDRFVETCLASLVGEALPGDALGAELVREADRAARELAGDVKSSSEFSPEELAARILAILERAFGDRELDLRVPADAELAEALGLMGERLRQLAALPEGSFQLDLTAAIRFLLATVVEQRLEGSGSAATGGVEVVGWLEIALDDAPCLVALDLVEGVLPATAADDAFLPDSLRARLGLLDDRRRLTRDLHLLETALGWRERVILLTHRRESDGQASRPSRLLLRRRGAALGERLERLLRGPAAGVPERLWPWSKRSAFVVPRPQPQPAPLRELSVTAFDDYLACPYRFYLKHVLRLEASRERPLELDGATFGGLAHEVLRRFALGPAAASADEREILSALLSELRALADESLRGAAAVARVQLAQLERRLQVFASWQAQQAHDGWRIDPRWVEVPLRAELDIDGVPFVVHGRIDRVDRHEREGFRILDYKSGERPESPASSHAGPRETQGRSREGRPWRSLQLPLYAHLARAAGLGAGTQWDGRWPALGVYALSKKLSAAPWLAAPWQESDLESALECARSVVRRLRGEVYWPPGPPPRWNDGLAAIAGDRFPLRYREDGAVGTGREPGDLR